MRDLPSLVAELRRPAVGTWVKLPSPESCEIVATAGFDFVVIDLEHAPISVESSQRLIMIASLAGVSPLVRVSALDQSQMTRLLDAGAAGLLVPHCEAPDQVRRGVAFSRYPPGGSRGLSLSTRSARWGQSSRAQHVAASDAMRSVIPQVESPDALGRLDDILGVEGIGAVFLGRADLSMAAGADEDDAKVAALLSDSVARCRNSNVLVGSAIGTVADVDPTFLSKLDFVIVGTDVGFLAAAARNAATQAIATTAAGDLGAPTLS